jgi:hypothetical protein
MHRLTVRRQHDEVTRLPSRSVRPSPRKTKNNWLVAMAAVWMLPCAMRMKLAHRAGLVAGPLQPSASLRSSGMMPVGPEKKKSGEKA